MTATAIIDGETVKKLRQERLITQADLAKKAGIRAESLCRLEKGKPAKFATIKQLADALGVEPLSIIKR